jgi:hypothetical protein
MNRAWLGFLLGLIGISALADCSLTNLGVVPLPDRGYERYKSFPGGLYPDFSNNAPPAHLSAALDIADSEIRPLNRDGNVDEEQGRIVMTSIGMSNTTQEFASKGPDAFKRRADADPSKNSRLIIVDGAQGGRPSTDWTNGTSTTWSTVLSRVAGAGVSSNQVQVLWMKQAQRGPPNNFPSHAQMLQADLEQIMRNAKVHFPNLKIAYVSSRTRSYSAGAPESTLNPEPQAFESAFSVKWMIEKQISGDASLNHDRTKGAVRAPLILWGPYLWADGTVGRSDGFIWRCNDLENDLTHPNTNGTAKVGAQLLAFFKTHPSATPWFLKKTVIGQPPNCTIAADITNGIAPLAVRFSANASDPDGTIRDHQWTFDDGTFATNAAPVKVFKTPGVYTPRVTVTDNNGNTLTRSITIRVGAVALGNPSLLEGRFEFPVVGATNYEFVVQRSDDLTSWVPVFTNRGPFTFSQSAPLAPGRYFRALLQPF